VDGEVDLVWGEAAAAHRYAVAVEDVADGSSFDPELGAQLVHRRAGLVAGDQLLDLLGAELPGTPRAVSFGRRREERVEAGEPLAELFQGFGLVFRVIISFPNLHNVSQPEHLPFWTATSESCPFRYQDCFRLCA
jgi:hypothetical protein